MLAEIAVGRLFEHPVFRPAQLRGRTFITYLGPASYTLQR